jgi:hypothetical protein
MHRARRARKAAARGRRCIVKVAVGHRTVRPVCNPAMAVAGVLKTTAGAKEAGRDDSMRPADAGER